MTKYRVIKDSIDSKKGDVFVPFNYHNVGGYIRSGDTLEKGEIFVWYPAEYVENNSEWFKEYKPKEKTTTEYVLKVTAGTKCKITNFCIGGMFCAKCKNFARFIGYDNEYTIIDCQKGNEAIGLEQPISKPTNTRITQTEGKVWCKIKECAVASVNCQSCNNLIKFYYEKGKPVVECSKAEEVLDRAYRTCNESKESLLIIENNKLTNQLQEALRRNLEILSENEEIKTLAVKYQKENEALGKNIKEVAELR